MKRIITIAAIIFGLAAALPSLARAQSAKDVVGVWDTVSVTLERADGTKLDPWGGKLKGRMIFTADGHVAQHNTRGDVPKFASNNRQTGTSEETTAAYKGSYSLIGTYTIDEAAKTMTVRILVSSYPNEIGTEQKRPFTVNGDEFTFLNPSPPSGGKGAISVLRRVK